MTPDMTPAQIADIAARAYQHMTPWRADQIAETLARPISLLSHTEAAFVLGQVIVDEAEILALAADPDHQRSRHASRALARFHSDAQTRGATRVFLEVASRNTPAIAFYTRHGYQQTGLRKAYYPRASAPADDALIMSRALP
jgi:ribosomal-protein-alanine N-acetyltransferase